MQQLKARSAERVVPITVMHGSNSSTNKETAFPGSHILKCAYLLPCIRTGSYPGSLQRETELFLDGFTEWVLESPLDWQASERNQEITAPAKILSHAKPQENYNYSHDITGDTSGINHVAQNTKRVFSEMSNHSFNDPRCVSICCLKVHKI